MSLRLMAILTLEMVRRLALEQTGLPDVISALLGRHHVGSSVRAA